MKEVKSKRVKADKTGMLAKAVDLAHKYYDEKNFEHAGSVYKLLDGKGVFTQVIGLFHDLLEDTQCSEEEIKSVVGASGLASVKRLTYDKSKPIDEKRYKAVCDKNKWSETTYRKDDLVKYYAYVEDIVNSGDKVAFEVKRADMLDHISRKGTLNEWLKAKYRPVLPMLKIDEQI